MIVAFFFFFSPHGHVTSKQRVEDHWWIRGEQGQTSHKLRILCPTSAKQEFSTGGQEPDLSTRNLANQYMYSKSCRDIMGGASQASGSKWEETLKIT